MSKIPKSFKAFRIHNDGDGYRAGVEKVGIDDLNDGDVVIRSEWSGINYKDALAATGVDTTFRLGDSDLATCLHRTMHLAGGHPLSAVTAGLAQQLTRQRHIGRFLNERDRNVIR